MAKKHQHSVCKHAAIKFCAHCDTVYCENCDVEWKRDVICTRPHSDVWQWQTSPTITVKGLSGEGYYHNEPHLDQVSQTFQGSKDVGHNHVC